MVGISVGNEFQVNTTTVDSQDNPNIAVDAQGNYVVVWQSGDEDSSSGIFAQRYDRFGTAIGGEIEIAADDTRPEFDPVVGMDAAGNFVVAWTDGSGNDNEVRARRFDSDGNALSEAFLVNTETGNNQDTPSIAMNADGQFVITWESLSQDGDGNGVFAQMYDSDGTPVGDEIAVNNITDGSQDDPVVAIDGNGNFVVAWEDSSGDIETINARRFDSTGTPLGESFVVSTTEGIDHDTPAIAMNDNGEFVITWESFDDLDGDRHGVFAQRYNSAGERIGDELAVNTTTAEDQDKPSVAIDAEGNFLITWESTDQDGSEDGVFGQYFDNTGAKQGSEFQINTFTNDDQGDVAVAMTPEGNAIATWDSFGQDGDQGGIFAQQLAVPATVEFSQPTFNLNEDGTVVGAEVTLTRNHDLLESEVQVSINGGTATPGLDFTNPFPLTVTFAPGEATKTVSIPVIEDAIEEGTETLDLSLTAISNAEIGEQGAATVNLFELVGIPVGNEVQVNTTTAGDQEQPHIAVDAQGNYVVVWESEDPESGDRGIFAQRYDRFGTALGGEIEVESDLGFDEFAPAVGMDASGNFVVVWTDEDGDGNEVRARRFDSDGNALSASFVVNTETASNQDTADIAMNADGQFVITWESSDGDSDGIFAQVYDPAGNPVGTEIAVNNITDGSQDDPVIAIDGNGNFVIAWEDRSTGSEEISARRFDSTGTPIGDSFVVNTTTDGNQDTPDIAMNANGEFVITWESNDEDSNGVFAQQYSATGDAIGDEIAVNTTTTSSQEDPVVGIDADGNFLIAWEDESVEDGGIEDIVGQYFDNTGAKLGGEFRVNTTTEGDQDDLSIAMDPNGNAIIAWESLNQDGDEEGIFAQQLAVPASVEFSQPTFTLNEDGSVVGAEVTLTRNHDLIESEVKVAVAGGTATAGLDFTDTFPLTVTFAPGETTQTISIPVLDDGIVEDTETLDLTLTAIGNAEIGAQSATTIKIIDNDIVDEAPPVDPAPVDPDLDPAGLKIRGSNQNDHLTGSEGDDLIRGRGGNDRLKGLAGRDRLIGGSGNDRLIGGSGDDTLKGGGGNDRLIGQAGDDLLNGGGGNDRLKGGAGSDELIGGRGDDNLIGGAGSDIFVLKKGHGTDFIRDFNIGKDQIRLQGSLSFRDLSFEQQGNNALIDARGETLATLRNIQANDLDRASFV